MIVRYVVVYVWQGSLGTVEKGFREDSETKVKENGHSGEEC